MKSPRDKHQDVSVAALMQALPFSGLEPQTVAFIYGFVNAPADAEWSHSIELLEPPGGSRVPYIEPVRAIGVLLRGQGISVELARTQAQLAAGQMRQEVAESHWVNFFDGDRPESPECVPATDLVAWLRARCERRDDCSNAHILDASVDLQRGQASLHVPQDVIDFFQQAIEVATDVPTFHGPDDYRKLWSLKDRPASPPPKSTIEFVPGPPWEAIGDWNEPAGLEFLRWREAIRPIAAALESALGEPVYEFADLTSELNGEDDYAHRLLVLHWCCTWRPQSAYVRYLMKISGAADIEELKAALVNPASYSQPFKMNRAFCGMETRPCLFRYVPPGTKRAITVVFTSAQARPGAEALLAQMVGARAYIIAPNHLATEEWLRQAARHCSGWTISYRHEHELDRPIDVLAVTDELWVIGDVETSGGGNDLGLSEAAENLLWLAIELGVNARYFFSDRAELTNPEACLGRRGVAERVAAARAQSEALKSEFAEVRLDADFGSSGLWDAQGYHLSCDLLGLTLPLARRIAAWQQDYDQTMDLPNMGDEAWWARHSKQALELAVALQAELGPGILVKLDWNDTLLAVDEIHQLEGGATVGSQDRIEAPSRQA
jgi:hypothetical protein